MTSIRSKILKPVLSLLFLIPLVLMIVFSAGISYYARQWAKEDLIHMANSISTTIKGDEQNIDRVIHLINTVKGSSSVEVIFYNPSRKIARIIRNQDRPGMVAEVTGVLSRRKVNIAAMQLYRNMRGGLAVMVIESDQPIWAAAAEELRACPGIEQVTYLDMEE